MNDSVIYRSILEHGTALERGEYSARELTQAMLARIDACDKAVGSFLTVDRAGALAAADASDARRANGTARGVLDGIPFGVKDNFCTAGLRTTCASRMLEDFVPPYSATAVQRLCDAGAILLGKQNMDEFAMGSSTEHSALMRTNNPHDVTRVPGGSSGGSAAAVAMGLGVFSLGSDTGGSVRQPASFCGVYGLKPTYGAISRYGVIEMATSLDSVGIFARTAEDCKTVFDVIAGEDPMDATSYTPKDVPIPARPLRVATLSELGEQSMPASVLHAVERVKDVLADRGAHFGKASLPAPDQALAAYSVLVAAESASNLARFDGIRYGKRIEGEDLFSIYANTRAEGFGDEVKRRILFGSYVLLQEHREAFYERAREVRRQVKRGMQRLFSECDLLLTPTVPELPFLHGQVRTPEQMYRADLCTVYANLAGLPAISIPFGKTENGLPLSVQLTAGRGMEALLFRVAEVLEAHCDPASMRPCMREEGSI